MTASRDIACRVRGFGAYTPVDVLTNFDLEKIVETTDEWITTRTGIKQRHRLAEGQNASDAAAEAARLALADAGMEPGEITHVINATCTPDYLCPNTACLVEAKLGIVGAMAFDFNAACSGYVYGLSMARAIVAAQPEARVLLTATEALTRRLNWDDRSTCVLFGDGAGASVVTAGTDGKGALLEDVRCASDGNLGGLLTIGGGTNTPYAKGDPIGDEFFVQMNGRDVFKHAVRNMAAISQEVLERNGLTTDDVALLIPHQANLRIIEAVGDRLGIPTERVFVNLHEFGNTSAASVPLAIADARAKGVLRPGMRVLLATFGGGFTWGAALLHF
ncbi:MAG TPA: 3-oxoacyl-ACP synthase [Desulfovibrio sp.]|jgi:3-oxoacyl-[acyl-carrier-protein] synthase-3|nr:3-oxoacyl-ACP synthase [Desulfovibrio sp.]